MPLPARVLVTPVEARSRSLKLLLSHTTTLVK